MIGLSEPLAEDVRAAGTGWFAALMLLLFISLVAVVAITAIKCRIGAIYPGTIQFSRIEFMTPSVAV